MQPLGIVLQHGAAMLVDALPCFGEMSHALAKFAGNAAAFLLAHLIEALENLADLRQNRGLNFCLDVFVGGIESAWDAEDCVEVGLDGEGEFGGGGAKCGNVSANQFAVERESLAAGALETEGNFHVAASDLFFEKTAQLHLQRVSAGRKAEVQIEEAVIDRLQRKSERQAPVGRSRGSTRRIVLDFAANLGEAGHGTYGHGAPSIQVSATTLGTSALANCNS